MFRALLLPQIPESRIGTLRLVLSDIQLGLAARIQTIGPYLWIPTVSADTCLSQLEHALTANGFSDFAIILPQPQGDDILYPVWDSTEEPPIVAHLHAFRQLERTLARQAKQAAKRQQEAKKQKRAKCRARYNKSR